ncbi:MAG: FAD-binding oxidoreductase [Spirochaetales bacterium]|nr:FAD-binding oxidoreductase [Spirochaetales bacterium]
MDAAWVARAREIAGDTGVLTDPADLEPYARDEYAVDSYVRPPLAVLRPSTEEQVAAVVTLCAEAGVPITARGGGTGLAAGCVPSAQGVVLSCERLNRVLEVDPGNFSITVQAGVTLQQIYRAADEQGLFFPPHPGDEGAMAGGMVATNAGGARAVKYGSVKRFLLGLQVVLADGQSIDLGGKFIKSSTGYNLLDLMVGSEGTLGVITRVTFRLLPRPGSIQTLVAPFREVSEAIESVPAILMGGIVPFAVEFVEHTAIACAERLLDKSWPARQGTASLMLMLDGSDQETVLRQAEAVAEILERQSVLDILIADQKAKQEEILAIRSAIYEALREGTAELFDVCVPRSEIAGHVAFVHELEARYGVELPTYGHAADGNVHSNYMHRRIEQGALGAEIPGWREKHPEVRREIFDDVIRRGGVVSGEHGIGLAKRDYLSRNLKPRAIDAMRAVKKALDPKGILNPGKVFEL